MTVTTAVPSDTGKPAFSLVTGCSPRPVWPASALGVQVLDPAETLLPYTGRIRFRGLERDGETLIPRVETVRDAYARRLEAQQDGLAALCSAAGFGFGVHRTDHPPETALLTLYAALGVR